MRSASCQSNICPDSRRTGLSMAMAPTSVATRPPAVLASTASTSARVKVAAFGPSGISVSPDSV